MLKTNTWSTPAALTTKAGWAKLKSTITLALGVFAAGCSGAQVNLESQFPTPLLEPIPLHTGIVLTDELLNYNYSEEIKGSGQFNIHIGGAQGNMFNRLGEGLFSEYTVLEKLASSDSVDAILLPEIMQMQMALPRQTRSEYFEVWMRYRFNFYDNEANLIGSWDLPAYGKANQNDYRGDDAGLKAAAISACRDAMAFFSLNFQSEAVAGRWAAGEKGTPAILTKAENTAESTTVTTADEKPAGDTADNTADNTGVAQLEAEQVPEPVTGAKEQETKEQKTKVQEQAAAIEPLAE